MEGIIFEENFIKNPNKLFDFLVSNVIWDDRMHARKTASFGKAYNYSHIQYSDQEFLREISELIEYINQLIGFKPTIVFSIIT